MVAAGNRGATPPEYWSHHTKRRITTLIPPVPGLYRPYVHANCICNEQISASNRVVGDVIKPTPNGIAKLKKAARLLCRQLPKVDPWSYEQVLETFKGRRRTRYQQAFQSLAVPLFKPSDSRISSFVKAEKFAALDKENPDPRMIQARNARYNIAVARFLKPMEHIFYTMESPLGFRMLAKGLNSIERASLLRQKLSAFSSPVVYSLDGSRWDKHIARQILEIEHSIYLRMNADPEFRQLLTWQLDNRCRTAGGVRYRVSGGRMSGDMNTALGNCLLMCLMVRCFCEEVGLKKWDLLDDGDDCLLLFESADEQLVQDNLTAMFREFGQEVKLENRAIKLEQVNFCRSKPVWNGSSWVFARNWKDVLSKDCCGVKNWFDPHLVRSMLTAIGCMNLALYHGVPVLQSFALACLRNGSGFLPKNFRDDVATFHFKRTVRGLIDRSDLVHIVEQMQAPITDESRLVFEEVWGLPYEQQLHIEDILSSWTIESVEAICISENLSGARWIQQPPPGFDVGYNL